MAFDPTFSITQSVLYDQNGNPISNGSGQLNIVSQPNTPTIATLSSTKIDTALNGDNTLIAGSSGKTIRVFRMFFIISASVNIILKDGASTNLTGSMTLAGKGSGLTLDFDGEPWFITSASNAFVMNLSAAVQISGRIYYTQS